MKTLSCLIRYLIALLLLIPMFSTALIIGIISRPAAWWIVVYWNQFFLKLFGVEVQIDFGSQDISEFKGGVIVGLNQFSLIDPTIGLAAAPLRYKSIWNIEYALIPFVGWVTVHLGWVIIRQWSKQSKKQLAKAVSHIQKGGFIYLSIEGRRSKDGSLSQYKKGPVVLAIQAQSNIIPVIVKGSQYCLPYGEWKIRPGTVTLKVLKAIPTKGMQYEDRNMLVDKLRNLAEKEIEVKL